MPETNIRPFHFWLNFYLHTCPARKFLHGLLQYYERFRLYSTTAYSGTNQGKQNTWHDYRHLENYVSIVPSLMCQIAKKNRIKTKVFGFNTDRKFFNQPASCNYTQSLVTCACNREKENWDLSETEKVTLIAGLAHVLSTVIIGILLGIIGIELSHTIEDFTRIIAPSIIILIGFYFIRQHYVHHHFHLQSRK